MSADLRRGASTDKRRDCLHVLGPKRLQRIKKFLMLFFTPISAEIYQYDTLSEAYTDSKITNLDCDLLSSDSFDFLGSLWQSITSLRRTTYKRNKK